MYELVKQKPYAQRILIGILIFLFITGLLKIAFHQSPVTINDTLIKMANEINLHAPIILDSNARLDYVSALHGNAFQFHYTLANVDKDQVDTASLQQTVKASMLEKRRSERKSAYFRENAILLQAMYVDRNKKRICEVSITRADYASMR